MDCTLSEMNFKWDHYSKLLVRTILPLGAMALLNISAFFLGLGKPDNMSFRAWLADKFSTAAFLIMFVIYPSTSKIILSTFQCVPIYEEDRMHRYLRTDYSIECNDASVGYNDPVFTFMTFYAAAMMLVIPLGVPLYYAYLLYFKYGETLARMRAIELLSSRLAAEKDALKAYTLHTQENNRQLMKCSSSCGAAVTTSSTEDAISALIEETEARILEIVAGLGKYEEEMNEVREKLPGTVQKLISGYELRVWWFEIAECFRKFLLVCAPVFFDPPGSAAQLTYGIMVCFLTYGALMLWAPYDKPEDDRLAQACQVQIFFALLADIILSYDEDPVQANSRIDWLLSGTTMGLLGLSIYQNTGVADWLGSSLAVAFTWFGTKRKKTGQEGQETQYTPSKLVPPAFRVETVISTKRRQDRIKEEKEEQKQWEKEQLEKKEAKKQGTSPTSVTLEHEVVEVELQV